MKEEVRRPMQLDAFEAAQEADYGLQQAQESAEQKDPGWNQKVYAYFLEWLFKKPVGFEFFIEDFRASLKGAVPEPPSARAYGFISKLAVKDKLITWVRIGKTRSRSAHSANASVWKKI